MKFRTKYNQGSYVDYEHYEPGTSLTEPGQAETMQQLIERMTRMPVEPIDLSDVNEATVDELLADSYLDEYADEGKTGMAQAINDFNEVVNAGRGSTAGTEAKEEQKLSDAKSGTDVTTTTNAHADGASEGLESSEG